METVLYTTRRLNTYLVLLFCTLCGCGGGGGGGSDGLAPEILVANAAFPVDLEVAPDGRIFYVELLTGLVRIIRDGTLLEEPFARLDVPGGSSEGLLGLAIDPDFQSNGFVYVFHLERTSGRNRVVRLQADGDRAAGTTEILDDLPRGGHNGGRLVFDASGALLVSTGDTGNANLAQSRNSLAGKILRINPDGTIPGDNPTPGSPVFALGLRNPYGLAVDPRDTSVYASDNGPSCDDELNLVLPGSNLGWRSGQQCGDSDGRFVQPLLRINPPVAPTGMIFYHGDALPDLDGALLMVDYLGGRLVAVTIDPLTRSVASEKELLAGLGPLLDVAVDPSGIIYLASQTAILRLAP